MDTKKISSLDNSIQMNASGYQPSVSVIVVNKDGINFVDECLASVLNSKYDNFEVVIVDNGSADGSPDFIKSRFNDHRLRLICLKKNMGLDEASDIGARNSSSKYLIFLNNDTKVHSDWITQLVAALEKDKTIGIAQSKVLMMHDQTRIDSLGYYIDPLGDSFRVYFGEYDDGRFSRPEEIFFAGGTVTIIQRDLYFKVGGFRKYFFIMHEDVDLSWRAWLSGHKAMCIPSSVVYHLRGGSTGRVCPLVVFHTIKNRISTMIQNYELSNVLKYVPLRMIIDFGTSLRYVYNKNIKIALAIVKGLLWVIINLKTVWRDHEEVKYVVRKITDEEILHKMASNGIPYVMVILHVFPFTRKLLARYMIWNLRTHQSNL